MGEVDPEVLLQQASGQNETGLVLMKVKQPHLQPNAVAANEKEANTPHLLVARILPLPLQVTVSVLHWVPARVTSPSPGCCHDDAACGRWDDRPGHLRPGGTAAWVP
eukprot:Sspe_Gene.50747::Locus_28230_Transcript_2_2_Confidence_0.667_Length_1836::g.50747::m.50747